MESLAAAEAEKPHALCIPFPAQGHITPMLKFAKLLHSKGFHITFVNTEYNHKRLLKSRGSDSLKGLSDFQFVTIPDGLPPTDADATQDILALCKSVLTNFLAPFRDLLVRLNDSSPSSNRPSVSCIVSDCSMIFTVQVAQQLGIPLVWLSTPSACGSLCYLHYPHLIDEGLLPLKDESYLTNGYLDTPINSIPGMRDMRLKDFPSTIRTIDANDFMVNFCIQAIEACAKGSALVMNTFEALDGEVLDAIRSLLPVPLYTIGPLQLLLQELSENDTLRSLGSNLWKEDEECLKWLDLQKPNSVLYVNYGSITVMTSDQFIEFAWGLANSKHPFLWIIRPDLVKGETAILPPEFVAETKDRAMISGWCPQEQVLDHPSIGGFLTHSGWNSTLETICSGVPIISWPFFAEQQTNCRYSCTHWGIGIEMGNDVRREVVENIVKELLEGEKSKEMKQKSVEWKKHAQESTKPDGSSSVNFQKLVNEVLLSR